jgi:predicted dehydrogenase
MLGGMVDWLVTGIGDISRKRVIPAILAEKRSRLAAVLRRDPRKAEAYPGVEAYTAVEQALAAGKFDAVYIASPVALHAALAVECLRAGKHVLCEKPAALNYAEAQTMVSVAKSSGRLLGVAYYRRLFPKLIRAKQLIADGAIGQPVLAEGNNHSWLPPAERGWLRDPALAGGGPLFDIGCHRIDAMHFLFGKSVRAVGMRSNAVHRLGVEDSATVLMDFENGARGVVDVRWNSHVARDQFRVIGTDGEMDLDPLSGDRMRVNGAEERLPTHANVHYPLIENFVDAAMGEAELACPGEVAIWTDWVMEQVMTAQAPL